MKLIKTKSGFIALTTVLILTAIFLLVSIGLVTLAISSGQNGLAAQFSQKAKLSANSCAEYALAKLQQSLDYDGDEIHSIGDDSCEIKVIGGTGNNNRIIQTIGNESDFIHKVEVHVEAVLPLVLITSWESVVDFSI